MAKNLFIITHGCQMNVYDSRRMADVLSPWGWRLTENKDEAEMVLINTCHIREKAEEKLFSDLGRWAEVKRAKAERGEKMILAVAGCVAQAQGDEIIRRQSAVDLVVGTGSYHKIAQMAAAAATKRAIVELDFPPIPKFDHLPRPQTEDVSAYLSVQEGCDKFCTFCVVPYTRGGEYSRPLAQVLDEARSMLANGVRELTLLGQNVNAYHGEGEKGGCSLGGLIFRLAELDGLKRIRYTTSHPKDMHEELYRAHAEVPQLMPFLHLPPQSGSDKILKAMNRRHTADDYRRVIDNLFTAREDMALGGDFIVAFPNESDADFAATLRLAEELPFAHSYSFIYSPRPGTPAALMPQVETEVGKRRLGELQTLMGEKRRRFNRNFIGKSLSVLVEAADGETSFGKSPYMQRVRLNHRHKKGDEVAAAITDYRSGGFDGVTDPEPRMPQRENALTDGANFV